MADTGTSPIREIVTKLHDCCSKALKASLIEGFDSLERFPGRLNLGVFSCWREYDSSILL
jgi:hypothetical protein